MTLGFTTHFPDGTPTLFVEKIVLPYRYELRAQYPQIAPKIHTFRLGSRWRAGMKMHLVTGNRTPQRRQFGQAIPELEYCKSVQTCIIRTVNVPRQAISVHIDGYEVDPQEFAVNDGFDNIDRLFEWFCHPFKATEHVGQIIHFSNFRYHAYPKTRLPR